MITACIMAFSCQLPSLLSGGCIAAKETSALFKFAVVRGVVWLASITKHVITQKKEPPSR